jgi:putative CocE/NonD family hydrolase
VLQFEPAPSPSSSSFVADPRDPVVDPYDDAGPHDYRSLQTRKDVLTFDSEPMTEELSVAGAVIAVIHASCDCRDFDLWVRLQDVHPDGRAFNLMGPGNDVVRASYRDPIVGPQPLVPGRVYVLRVPTLMTVNLMHPGNDVIRASYRDISQGRQPLEPGVVYELRLPALMTGIRFARGHRIRAQISAAFAPHMSRNLQTGESEVHSAASRAARLTIHYGGPAAGSRLLLPVAGSAPTSGQP